MAFGSDSSPSGKLHSPQGNEIAPVQNEQDFVK